MKTILLIEDDYHIRANTMEILNLSGYNTIDAANGEIGIDLALKNKPDIVLCDINMPQKSGYDVLKELKANKVTAGIPFIFLTAVAEKRAVELGAELGAVDCIVKPFDHHELLAVIKKHLPV